jgi:hypothetical protein
MEIDDKVTSEFAKPKKTNKARFRKVSNFAR